MTYREPMDDIDRNLERMEQLLAVLPPPPSTPVGTFRLDAGPPLKLKVWTGDDWVDLAGQVIEVQSQCSVTPATTFGDPRPRYVRQGHWIVTMSDGSVYRVEG
jgi:hypothetical protein